METRDYSRCQTVGWPLRILAGVEWNRSKPPEQAVYAMAGRTREVGLPKSSGTQKPTSWIRSRYQTPLTPLDLLLVWFYCFYVLVLAFWNKKYVTHFWFCRSPQIRDLRYFKTLKFQRLKDFKVLLYVKYVKLTGVDLWWLTLGVTLIHLW